jgi:5-methylthioadenosine/S-adenosylhomocysteine deaminase
MTKGSFQAMQHNTSSLLVRGCDLLIGPGLPVREDVDLLMVDELITDIQPSGTRLQSADAVVLDGHGLLALPGFVNAHTHSPESALRGVGEGLTLEPWLCVLFATAGVYDPDDHYACALAGAAEMLHSGTTAVLDHLWMTPPRAEAVEAVLRAYRDIGIRAAVAPMLDDSDDTEALARSVGVAVDGGLFPRQRELRPPAELAGLVDDLAHRWHGAAGGRLQVLAGCTGVQWCSDQLLVTMAEVAHKHQTGMHLHLLETWLQDRACRLRFGVSAAQGLDRLGLLGRCSLAHAVWLDATDVDLVAERGAVVVHNPAANLRLGSGTAPVRALLDAGATVALGSDGAASSDNQVLWDQVKLASLVHVGVNGGGVSASEALTMATAGGAATLSLSGRLGRLEPGMLADIVLLDRRGDGLAGAVDLEVALALSETGRAVRHVIVDGQVVVRDGRCVRVDEDAVRAALAAQAARRRLRGPLPPASARAMARLEQLAHTLRGREGDVDARAGRHRRLR